MNVWPCITTLLPRSIARWIFSADEQRADRLIAGAQTLGDRQHVGRDALLLARVARAGAAHAAHHFVEDQQHAVAVADFADALEVAGRRGNRAERRADDGLGDERGDVVGAELDDLRFELVRHAQPVRFGGFVRRLVAVRVARRDVVYRIDQHRLELAAAPDVAARGQRAERVAVITLAARDHEFSLRLTALDEILACQFQRRFDGLGAAAGQPHVGKFAGCVRDEVVGKPFRHLGREKSRVREREPIGLSRIAARTASLLWPRHDTAAPADASR